MSGELTDWVYGELGVPGYTIEMGTSFFESCDSFQTSTYPSNRPALYYAAKACRQPYQSPAGPDVLQVTLTNSAPAEVRLSALAVSGRSFGYVPLPTPAPITAARFSVDHPSWETGATTFPMTATDGNFDSASELVSTTLDTTAWAPGRHIVFIEASTGTTNWGVPTATFVSVPAPKLTATLSSNHMVLTRVSTTNT